MRIPAGRLGRDEDIAQTALMLACNQYAYGQVCIPYFCSARHSCLLLIDHCDRRCIHSGAWLILRLVILYLLTHRIRGHGRCQLGESNVVGEDNGSEIFCTCTNLKPMER